METNKYAQEIINVTGNPNDVTECDECPYHSECYQENKLIAFHTSHDLALCREYGYKGSHATKKSDAVCNRKNGLTCFVIAYSSDWCQIEPTYFEKDTCRPESTLYWQYKEGLSRRGGKFGERFCWNNRHWGIVWAVTAAGALGQFMGRHEQSAT